MAKLKVAKPATKKKVVKPAAKKTAAKTEALKPAAKKTTAKKKIAKPAAKKKSSKKPLIGKDLGTGGMGAPTLTMSFDPRSDSGAIDSTVSQTFTGTFAPFIAGMTITVTKTGGAGPNTIAATVNADGTFSVIVPSGTMAPNTNYVLSAHSSAGHPDATFSFHTAP